MAIPTLAVSGYVLPGAYLGRLARPRPSGALGLVRLPCFVGRGNRLKYQKDARLVRSFIEGEAVTFSNVTFLASLQHPSNGDKTVARLYKADGTVVDAANWNFTTIVNGSYTQISIKPEVFDATATYQFDYQSTSRSVLDTLPFSELREMLFVGDSQGQKRYTEGLHYFITYAVTQPVADAANANRNPSVSVITPGGGNAGNGVVTFNASNAPTYKYNRAYTLEVTVTGGGVGTETGTIRVTAVALGGGNDAVPDQTVANQGEFTFSYDAATPATLLNIDLGHGLRIDLDVSGGNFAVGDTFTFDLLGGARYELEAALANTNQYASLSTPTAGALSQPAPAANTGTGTVAAGSDSAYSGTTNRKYELEVTAAGGAAPNRTATVRWRSAGELPASTGVLNLAENTAASFQNVTVEQGIKLTFDFGGVNFAVGDHFIFTALAPRLIYTGKDDRTVEILTTAAPAGPGATVTYVWQSDTVEGGFATVATVAQDVSTTLRNNLKLRARNLVRTNNAAYHTNTDKHSFTAFSTGKVDWSLQEKATETIATTDIRHDATGVVTGTIGAYYLILDNQPDTVVSVKNASSGAAIAYSQVAGTPFIVFATNPGVQVQVVYLFKSLEPDPGNSYFVTATILRPTSDFDNPILIKSPDDADTKLGPMTTSNHALMAALLAFDNDAFGCYVVQVRDRDEDGIFTNYDFKQAIAASETKKDISDLVVLSNFGSLSDAKASVESMNDPFKRRPRMGWFGAPIGTAIGDVDTSGTLVYTAKQVLQVFGNSPSHGKFVMVGNTWAKVQVLLPDESIATVTLDGSFIAAALAAKTASFTDPSETLLFKDIAGFIEMEDFDEAELRLLGAGRCLTLDVIGDPPAAVFRCIESITTDPDARFAEVSYITQDEAVVRQVNSDVESATISAVPPTEGEGTDLVGNAVLVSLARMAASGRIAPYQDESGNERKIDRGKDIIVAPNPEDDTRYDYLFGYFRKKPIKYVFGLYTTDAPDITKV